MWERKQCLRRCPAESITASCRLILQSSSSGNIGDRHIRTESNGPVSQLTLMQTCLIDTLASEVKCLRVIKRRDLSNERNTFKSKTIFYHKKTRLKPERATRPIPKRRRPLYATATRPIPSRKEEGLCTRQLQGRSRPEKKKASVRDSYKADPEKKKASVRDNYNADIESKQSAKRQRYQEDLEENRAAKRQRYQEDVEENRAAKRQKYEDNSAAIKASERNRYWNDPAVRLAKRAAERKRYRRGH
ncbi:hypothetical protein EMCRGX_G023573 [Ephydatia muelleri]